MKFKISLILTAFLIVACNGDSLSRERGFKNMTDEAYAVALDAARSAKKLANVHPDYFLAPEYAYKAMDDYDSCIEMLRRKGDHSTADRLQEAHKSMFSIDVDSVLGRIEIASGQPPKSAIEDLVQLLKLIINACVDAALAVERSFELSEGDVERKR